MANSLTIGRLNGRYTLPHGHPQPEGVKVRLDDVLRQWGTAVIGRLLAQTLPAYDPSIWLIRHLDFTLVADIGKLDTDELSRLWGQQVTQTIIQAIAGGPDGRNVLYFPHRAAYVAQFVADVVNGTADDKWYYSDFGGLRHLSTSQAVREALVREGETAVLILHQLSQTQQLERVLNTLTDNDTSRLVDLLPITAAAVTRQAWQQVLGVWSQVVRRENGRYLTPKNQLRLWLAAYEGSSTAPPDLTAMAHLLQLADLLTVTADPMATASRLARGESDIITVLVQQLGEANRASLLAWQAAAGDDSDWLMKVVKVLVPQKTAVSSPTSSPSTIPTPLGSLFLLLPILLDLHLPDLFENLTQRRKDAKKEEGNQHSATSRWLYWLLLKCLGEARAWQWRDNPALLLALGLTEVPQVPSEFAPAQLADLRREWRTILRDQGRADGRFLALELTARPQEAEEIAVLRDMRHDYWLDVGIPGEVQLTIDHLQLTIDDFCLRHGDEKPDWLAAAVPDYAAKAKPAAATLAYCRLPDLPPDLDLTLTLLAQGVLRTFARHLLGFAWSSPSYLYDNFLAGESLVTIRDDEIRVQLPASPLHTVLRLTGWHETSYTVPWLPDQTITLYLP